MKKLLQGVVDFQHTLTDEMRELFSKLALGQKPDALFIACSDSRVVPNLFASTNPGDVFVVRNVGNLVPPCACCGDDASVAAAIEFSVLQLEVADIIVCGHSECGAIHALNTLDEVHHPPHLANWLQHAKAALASNPGLVPNPRLSPLNQLSQANVLLQLRHLMSYDFVSKRVSEGRLRLHGWWFDIARVSVLYYSEPDRRFIAIDDACYETILRRLS